MYIENVANKEKLSESLDLLEDLRKKGLLPPEQFHTLFDPIQNRYKQM